MTLRTPQDITNDLVLGVGYALHARRYALLEIDEGKGPKAVIITALPIHGVEHIVVAMDGSGAAFLARDSHINPFVFITAGFQIIAAQIVTKLFLELVIARATDGYTKRASLQLNQPPQE